MTTPIQISTLTIPRVLESQAAMFPVAEFFPTLAKEVLEENRSWLEPTYFDPATGKVVLAFQSFIVQTPHHNILVDSCVGNHKPRPMRPARDKMQRARWRTGRAATGLAVGDIDFVMCTHLHVDHVGWNTRLENGRWVPTFKNAKYVWSQEDFDFYKQLDSDPQKGPANGGSFRDSVLPVVEAGKVE